LADEPDPTLARHPQIGDDDRRRSPFEQLQRLLGGAGGLTLIVPGTGGADENILGDRFIIHDRNRDSCRSALEGHLRLPSLREGRTGQTDHLRASETSPSRATSRRE